MCENVSSKKIARATANYNVAQRVSQSIVFSVEISWPFALASITFLPFHLSSTVKTLLYGCEGYKFI